MANEGFFATHPTLRRVFIGACLIGAVYAVVQMFGADRAWVLVEATARLVGLEIGSTTITEVAQ